MTKTKYPIYIVSKGRAKTPYTANLFKEYNLDFKIAVEPQEVEEYSKEIGEEYILELPFSNLGQGSFPARNFIWDHAKQYSDKHWIFDDNIRNFRYFNKAKRNIVNPLVAISSAEEFGDRYLNLPVLGFNYTNFASPKTKKAFYLNAHVYSAILISNFTKYRWRLKYNEDVDLTLQALTSGDCTALLNVFTIDKISTTAKLRGGNQDELYKNNDPKKKQLKAKSLEMLWPKYAETVIRFNRPHHFVDWGKHFKQPLIRKVDISKLKPYQLVKNSEVKA